MSRLTDLPSAHRQRGGFIALLAGLGVSTLADGLLFVVLPVWVFQETGSPFQASLAFTAQVAPRFLLVTVAGLLADRVEKKALLVVSILARTVTIAGLFLVLDGASLSAVYALLAIDAAITAFAQPASSALVPYLVSTERLQSSNAMLSTAYSIAQLVSPALGSLLLVWLPISYAVGSTVVLYVLSALILVALPRTGVPRTDASGVIADSVKGFSLVLKTRVLASLHGTLFAAWLAQGMLLSVAIPWLDGIPGLTSDVFGIIVAAMGLGMVLGGTVTSLRAPWSPHHGYAVGLFASAVFLAVAAFMTTLVAIAGAFVATGFFFAVSNAARPTIVQVASSQDALGRVFAVQGALIEGARLIGILVAPALLVRFTPTETLLAACLLTALGGVAYTPLAAARQGQPTWRPKH